MPKKMCCAERIIRLKYILLNETQNMDDRRHKRMRHKLHYWQRKQRRAQHKGLYLHR